MAAIVRRTICSRLQQSRMMKPAFGLAPQLPGMSLGLDCLKTDCREYRHRGVLKLHCSECRYVIRRWHVPILAVDCNANKRHKQAMTNNMPRSRAFAQFPRHLLPWVQGKQYPRFPAYRQGETYQCYSKDSHRRLR
mmetsp:Transcript_12243/g.27757  ORF Transcript_12243/g.27757 Transcript_12243/m.27757 type:complete len:136 (+) Transcript_12243:72-479(+)